MPIHRATFRIAAALGLAAGLSATARADLITYTETTTISGELVTGGIQRFTNATVTFTQTADTANILENGAGGYSVVDTTSTFAITGVGTGSFAGTVQDISQAGRIVATSDTIPFAGVSYPGTTYNLATNFAYTGTSAGAAFVFQTSNGALIIDSEGQTTTFTAQLAPSAVPAPPSLVLVATGALMVLGHARLRRPRMSAA